MVLFVPVVGIIAAISIPAYQDYTIRAQISEGLNISGGAKAAVTEYYFDNNQLPPDNATAGLVPATEIYGKYVSSVQVTAGEVVVTYGNNSNQMIQGQVLVLRPVTSDQKSYKNLKIDLLGSIPLELATRISGDEGEPIVIRDPKGTQALRFISIARQIAAHQSVVNFQAPVELPTL